MVSGTNIESPRHRPHVCMSLDNWAVLGHRLSTAWTTAMPGKVLITQLAFDGVVQQTVTLHKLTVLEAGTRRRSWAARDWPAKARLLLALKTNRRVDDSGGAAPYVRVDELVWAPKPAVRANQNQALKTRRWNCSGSLLNNQQNGVCRH